MKIKKEKAIFLDRDGTINKEVHYLSNPSDFCFIPGVVDAIKIFHDLGFLVIIITNQSGVARGYFSEEDVKEIHCFIDEELKKASLKESGGKSMESKENGSNRGYYIDAYYYCPHHPDGVVEEYALTCKCRKPNTGLIDKAIADFKEKGKIINLSESFIVGDKETDLETGRNAGIGKKVLVCSGHSVDKLNTIADIICDNLAEFAQILSWCQKD